MAKRPRELTSHPNIASPIHILTHHWSHQLQATSWKTLIRRLALFPSLKATHGDGAGSGWVAAPAGELRGAVADAQPTGGTHVRVVEGAPSRRVEGECVEPERETVLKTQ